MAGERPSWWRRARLGDVADVNWGDTSTTKAAYVTAGFPAYSASGPDGFLPYADFDRTGVVLSAIGADCGKTWLAKGKWSCIKNTIRFWAANPEVDSAFLYWLTSDPAIWPKRGSAQPFISQGDARALEIAYPPLPEQRAIAHILGMLDDKIELNRRMNEALEAIARAIFKSWFVDFDPVRVKAEGRCPCLPKPIADLFPDAFEDSELGEIPAGWGMGVIGDLCEVAIGGDWGEDAPFDGGVEVYCLRGVDLEHLRFSGYADAPRRWVKGTSVVRRRLDESDVLVAGSGVGPTGRPLWAAPEIKALFVLPVIYSNFCKRLHCESAAVAIYLDRWLQVLRESGEIWEYVNGTSVPNLDANALLNGSRF